MSVSGLCPRCCQSTGYLNVGCEHWGTCVSCGCKWRIGSNLFSTWRAESEADWKRNAALLDSLEEVEPVEAAATPQPELTMRQRFELALRVVDVETRTGDAVAPMAALVRFIADEGITPSHFTKKDFLVFHHATTAAGFVAYPNDFPPGSPGGKALTAAGLPCGPEDPEDPDGYIEIPF